MNGITIYRSIGIFFSSCIRITVLPEIQNSDNGNTVFHIPAYILVIPVYRPFFKVRYGTYGKPESRYTLGNAKRGP